MSNKIESASDSDSDSENDTNYLLLETMRKDIIDIQDIVSEFIITEDEQKDLTSSAYYLICDFIECDTMIYIKPLFHSIVSENVYELLKYNLNEYFQSETDDSYMFSEYVDKIIKKCIEDAFELYYKNVCPRRSFKNTFVSSSLLVEEEEEEEDKITEQLEYLKNIPQPQQRSKEWYEFRQNIITASNIYNLFTTQNALNKFIYEKCNILDTSLLHNNYIDITSPMGWGQLCEPISVQYYEYEYKTQIGDFGCIPHKTISCLAASPDGINILKGSPRYGRMLEIKNITNREIDGIPKLEYWIQMQIQMEVCDLDECDFLETQFNEYNNEEEFNADFNVSSYHKGIILYFSDNGKSIFEYSKWGNTRDELYDWENKIIYKHKNIEYIRTIYWKLEKISCVLVMRNKMWFNSAKLIILDVWNTIENEKKTGEYIKRKGNKKPKKSSLCLINMNILIENEDNVYYDIYDFSGCKMDIEINNSTDM